MTNTARQPDVDELHDVAEPVLSLMTRTVAFVDSDTTLRVVVDTMADKGLGALIVLGPDGPSRIVSERDVVHALARGGSLDATLAIDVASTELVSARPDDLVIEAARLMGEHAVRHIPVQAGTGIVGMVSARDVLRVLSSQSRTPKGDSEAAS